ncbi:DUF885 family protein [Aliikangiella sp. G2MR2-5]|uniref:DUF885 domain-containing protein n=1 Tax=Aliikangiella sp. G2MR2-5 TaxID=2788943 RepID=UPI0018A92A30|nr:DUF885 domain-containing protein [Aliikangiella sp. G2MR2-5]
MKSTIWKYSKRILLVGFIGLSIFLINLIWFRPFFIGHFYDKIFFEFALENPQMLTNIGVKYRYGELNDNSIAANEASFELLKKDYQQLKEYEREGLEGQELLSYDILDWFLKDQMDAHKYRYNGYSVTQRGGSYQGIINFMVNMHRVEDSSDAEDYVSRISQIGSYFDNTLESVKQEQEHGVVPPDFIISKVLENLHNIRDPELNENVLVKDFNKKVDALSDLSEEEKSQLKAQMLAQMEAVVQPAYDRYIQFFENLKDDANSNAGVWKFPNGAEYYQHRIRSVTTTDYTAEELHQLGLVEVDRIVAEMEAILESQGYSGKSVGQIMNELGEDPKFLYPDTDEGREQILADYRAMITEVEAGMDKVFDIMPKSGVEVKRVPEYREKTAAGGSYQGPSIDGSRPGIFFANLYDIKATPKFSMRTLAYHEAIPGHHFQIAIKTELEGLPMFRNFIGFTSYSEGWALYAERLAWEQGYQQEPFSDLGRLQAELMRAVRLVVDTGIHHKRWTREQAIDYMASTTGLAMTDVESEIERYIVWPGQALAYKVGMLKILELREKAEKALGDKYDIRKFHNVVLKSGAVPMTILERMVDDYIARDGEV